VCGWKEGINIRNRGVEVVVEDAESVNIPVGVTLLHFNLWVAFLLEEV
jgi:hypothetical protein